jgi:hypothetical protein
MAVCFGESARSTLTAYVFITVVFVDGSEQSAPVVRLVSLLIRLIGLLTQQPCSATSCELLFITLGYAAHSHF